MEEYLTCLHNVVNGHNRRFLSEVTEPDTISIVFESNFIFVTLNNFYANVLPGFCVITRKSDVNFMVANRL